MHNKTKITFPYERPYYSNQPYTVHMNEKVNFILYPTHIIICEVCTLHCSSSELVMVTFQFNKQNVLLVQGIHLTFWSITFAINTKNLLYYLFHMNILLYPVDLNHFWTETIQCNDSGPYIAKKTIQSKGVQSVSLAHSTFDVWRMGI